MPNPLGDTPLSGALQSDLLWRNTVTGENRLWHLDGTQFAFNSSAPQFGEDYKSLLQVADRDWKLKGTGDFNNDGKQDAVWRNQRTGQNIVWYLNHGKFITNPTAPRLGIDFDYLPAAADTSWDIQAIGDFNLDGYRDIVWRKQSGVDAGTNAVWYLKGTQFATNPDSPQVGSDFNYFTRVTDQNWQIKGAGDFNGDGFLDLFWRNSQTGSNLVWFLKNNQFAQNPNAPQAGRDYDALAAVTDQDWDVATIGYFNGDRKIDIVWRNKRNATSLAWFLDGTDFAVNNDTPQENQDFAYIPAWPDGNWEIVGALTRSKSDLPTADSNATSTPTTPPAPTNNGSSLALAFDLGTINGSSTRQEAISTSAANDYYRFTVGGQRSISVLLNGLSSNANLQILDAAGNRVRDAFNRFSEDNSGTDPEVRNRILDAGTYYLRVYGENISTNYNLSILGLNTAQSDTDRVVEITNFYRTQSGLNALAKNTQLTNAAQGHSQSMAINDFFDHTGIDGSSSTQRAQAAGYGGVAGENIAAGQLHAEHVMERWMYSPGHRSNIFDNRYDDIGIGYYYLANDTGSQNWQRYWTSEFGIRT